MKLKSKVTVSLLSLLMLGGISAGSVSASTKAQNSQEALIKMLETPKSVQRAKQITVKKSKVAKHVKKRRAVKAHTKKGKRVATKKHARRHARKNVKKVNNKRRTKRVRRHVRKPRVRKARKNARRTHRVRKNSKVRVRRSKGVNAHKRATNWFNDGLSTSELSARNWVTAHESGHEWNVLSYGGVCVGYFQLSPGYLGYKNGHVNLDHAHQVKVADRYVHTRYGSWVNAQRFWATHNWY